MDIISAVVSLICILIPFFFGFFLGYKEGMKTMKRIDDYISRQAAIDAICEDGTQLERQGQYSMTMAERKQRDADILDALPSAQPGIIRCKDCKYRDENWRRVSVRWLPCMDVRTGSNWYCGSAERKDDE